MADQAAREAQSAATKEANFEDAAAKIGQKMKDHPEQITSEDASLLESREHRAMVRSTSSTHLSSTSADHTLGCPTTK